ncbi:FAD:protein FMN transferase [Pigmentiphaga litoralis]|uniref:FAD:protein FMN transferase n=1 Tax=Pigmentiphaga litoralis TaxID=516702 RepID=A0A7Y9IVA5_9BURK|nr:FAD:protein FMN transferase [Pigmentiphaga litoralis]NYE23233.1 thiamine biosynthesis lipoprotein [Pigmentiphaga litoralis]NYE83153.1 thiamine biosynthesis lipoprotein [Pigmentiphaga litoralis]
MTRILIPLAISPADLPPPAADAAPVVLSGDTMGTTWSVTVVLPLADALPGARAVLWGAIQAALDEVVLQMSTWDPESDLSRFNAAPAGTWHTLPEPFYTVLDYALTVARNSGGAFDPTVGPLVDLWGFGPLGAVSAPPANVAIDAARRQQGWAAIKLDPATRRAWQPGGVSVDLSGVAKGYGVDHLVKLLRRLGHAHALVEVGGELRGVGAKPSGEPWWVELEAPADDGGSGAEVGLGMLNAGVGLVTLNAGAGAGVGAGVGADGSAGAADSLEQRVDPEDDSGLVLDARGGVSAHLPRTLVALHGLAVATSGDYRRYFEVNGERFSHTIDPRTGYPVASRVASVTVLHPECMVADALATALTVLGEQDGPAWAGRNGLAARFVVREGKGWREVLTPAFLAMAS